MINVCTNFLTQEFELDPRLNQGVADFIPHKLICFDITIKKFNTDISKILKLHTIRPIILIFITRNNIINAKNNYVK